MRIERYRSACLSAIAALSCSLLSAGALQAAAPLKLASLFTDHAVLQRDMPVPVWGDAEPGRNVTVQFAGQEKTAAVDKDGHWLIKLDPLTASAEGRTLTAKTPDDAPLTKSDILVGEVWICSGQSNMGFGLAGAETGPAALAAAGDNELRPVRCACSCGRRAAALHRRRLATRLEARGQRLLGRGILLRQRTA